MAAILDFYSPVVYNIILIAFVDLKNLIIHTKIIGNAYVKVLNMIRSIWAAILNAILNLEKCSWVPGWHQFDSIPVHPDGQNNTINIWWAPQQGFPEMTSIIWNINTTSLYWRAFSDLIRQKFKQSSTGNGYITPKLCKISRMTSCTRL